MKECRYCRSRYDDNLAACPNCGGTKVVTIQELTEEAADIQQEAEYREKANAASEIRKKRLIGILFGVVIITIVVIAAILFKADKQPKSPDEPQGTLVSDLCVGKYRDGDILTSYTYSFDGDNNILFRCAYGTGEIIKYNAIGKPEFEEWYSVGTNSEPVLSFHYEYDEQGLLVEKDCLNYESNTFFEWRRLSNNATSAEWYYFGDNNISASRYMISEYTEDNRIYRETYYLAAPDESDKAEIVEIIEYEYDNDGNLISEIFKDAAGTVKYKNEYEYAPFSDVLMFSIEDYGIEENVPYIGLWECKSPDKQWNIEVILGHNGLCWIEYKDDKDAAGACQISSYVIVENASQLSTDIAWDLKNMTPDKNPLTLLKKSSNSKLVILWDKQEIELTSKS